jgi:hypothetical protein
LARATQTEIRKTDTLKQEGLCRKKKLLRTQDERFKNLSDYPFEPNYVQVKEESLSIRLHYVDEGDGDADPCS